MIHNREILLNKPHRKMCIYRTVQIHPYVHFLYCSRKFKGVSGLFFTPMLVPWSSGQIGGHVWRWVIVPSDLTQSFGAICRLYSYRVIHHAITIMWAWFHVGKATHTSLAGIAMTKSGDTIMLLHMWPQDVCRNKFPLKVPWYNYTLLIMQVYSCVEPPSHLKYLNKNWWKKVEVNVTVLNFWSRHKFYAIGCV